MQNMQNPLQNPLDKWVGIALSAEALSPNYGIPLNKEKNIHAWYYKKNGQITVERFIELNWKNGIHSSLDLMEKPAGQVIAGAE